MDQVLDDLGIGTVNGIYLDLGVSSYQLDTVSRGFTYREDAPLDMRMDQRNPRTAADIVNTYSEGDLYRQTDLPGHPHRTEPGAGGAGAFH